MTDNNKTKTAIVLGAGGFIGSHMVQRLKKEGYWVRGVDIKYPEFKTTEANNFIIYDLSDPEDMYMILTKDGQPFDEIYQFAADMGGAGYVFTGENDANIMLNSSLVNLNVLKEQSSINEGLCVNKTKIFFSSSACVYPKHNQIDPEYPVCREDSAYPANPDSDYGLEKLFSERLYFAFNKNYNIPVRVARYHNIFGVNGTWKGGKEKAPAAFCRKIALAKNDDFIDVWGDGKQTRSFLYIDECIEATRRLMESDFIGPINIGSEEMVSIDQLMDTTANVAFKTIFPIYITDGPVGVKGRNSDNTLIREKLGWDYTMSLVEGIQKTYMWIEEQIEKERSIL